MNNVIVGCPKCGSQNVRVVSDVTSSTKGFGAGKGCLGYICFGPIGLLCGLLGMGEGRTKTTTYRVCGNCGARFK
jgi:ribosomal protein L40E